MKSSLCIAWVLQAWSWTLGAGTWMRLNFGDACQMNTRQHVSWICNVVQKKASDCSHASRTLVVFCKPILAMLLQRKRQQIIMHIAYRSCCVGCVLYCYKENVNRSSCISHIAVAVMVVFCKPILAILLQRKRQQIIMHIAYRSCCVGCVL